MISVERVAVNKYSIALINVTVTNMEDNNDKKVKEVRNVCCRIFEHMEQIERFFSSNKKTNKEFRSNRSNSLITTS